MFVTTSCRIHNWQDYITIKHHCRVNIFVAMACSQLQELNCRFNEKTMEVIKLSMAKDPKDIYKAFQINYICNPVAKFHPRDII